MTEPVGSLGEEAAKLWGALSEWAQEAGQEAGAHEDEPGPDPLHEAATHSARGLAEALRRVNDHLATEDTECRYCPVCRVVHAVRGASPEVRQHLGEAAGSLLSAAASLLADRDRPDAPDASDDPAGGSGPQ